MPEECDGCGSNEEVKEYNLDEDETAMLCVECASYTQYESVVVW